MDKFSREWFVIYSNPQKEEQARFHLSLKGLQTFFPRLQIPVAGENKSRITPLFRNYLFACIDVATERHLVVWTPGVRKIVSCGDEPVPIKESVVRFLQRQADARGVIQARSKLERGREVEISGGPFSGLVGMIQDPPDDRGRVNVLLKLLSRQVSVRLGVEFINSADVSWAPAGASDSGLDGQSAKG